MFYTDLLLPGGLVQRPCFATFIETSVLKEVYILYPFSHNKITMLLILNVQNNAANTKCPGLNKIMTRNEKCIKHKMLQLV